VIDFEFAYLRLDQIDTSENFRARDKKHVEELKDQIEEHGFLANKPLDVLLVRTDTTRTFTAIEQAELRNQHTNQVFEASEFSLVNGQHRHRAALELKMKRVPCRVYRTLTPEQLIEVQGNDQDQWVKKDTVLDKFESYRKAFSKLPANSTQADKSALLANILGAENKNSLYVVVSGAEFPYTLEVPKKEDLLAVAGPSVVEKIKFRSFPREVKEALVELKKLTCAKVSSMDLIGKMFEVIVDTACLPDLVYLTRKFQESDRTENPRLKDQAMWQIFGKRIIVCAIKKIQKDILDPLLMESEEKKAECKRVTGTFVSFLEFSDVRLDEKLVQSVIRAGKKAQTIAFEETESSKSAKVVVERARAFFDPRIREWKQAIASITGEIPVAFTGVTLNYSEADGESKFAQLVVQDIIAERLNPNLPKGDLVFADLPYFLYPNREFDNLEFCAGKDVTEEEFLENAIEAIKNYSQPDSFIFVFCGVSQIQKLINAGNRLGSAQHFIVLRTAVTSASVLGKDTQRLTSAFENGVFIRRGQPNWANYFDETGKLQTFLPNYFSFSFRKHDHPFAKPLGFYDQMVHCFGKKQGTIVELFAGSCPSLFAAVKYRINVICVEKASFAERYFKESFGKALVKAGFKKDDTHLDLIKPKRIEKGPSSLSQSAIEKIRTAVADIVPEEEEEGGQEEAIPLPQFTVQGKAKSKEFVEEEAEEAEEDDESSESTSESDGSSDSSAESSNSSDSSGAKKAEEEELLQEEELPPSQEQPQEPVEEVMEAIPPSPVLEEPQSRSSRKKRRAPVAGLSESEDEPAQTQGSEYVPSQGPRVSGLTRRRSPERPSSKKKSPADLLRPSKKQK
jgi:hypothetical protein